MEGLSKDAWENRQNRMSDMWQVGKNPRGLSGAIVWSDLMETGLPQDQEECSWSVATPGCVCTDSGQSIHVLLLDHSHGSAFPLWLLSCPPSHFPLLSLQHNWWYVYGRKGIWWLCTVIPTGLISGNLRGTHTLSWSKQLSSRIFSKTLL